MKLCKCGCKTQIPDKKTFVDTAHYWVWKRAQEPKSQSPGIEPNLPKSTSNIGAPDTTILNDGTTITREVYNLPWYIRVYKRIFPTKPKEIEYPKKLLTTKEIREIKQKQEEEKLTDEQKFLRVFGNLPKWTTKKPGFFTKWRLGKEFRHVVFVTDELDKQDAEAFIPFNKDLGMLQTDTEFYDMPVKEKGTIYLNKRKYRPVVNGDDYAKEFDIPEDFATSLTNRGIKFGQLAQFDKVIKKIDMIMLCLWGLAIAVFILGIFAFLTVYSDNKAIHDMAGQVGNMSQQMARINP